MKEISEVNLPADLRYAESHEYVREEGDQARIGIDDYAQDQLGEIVFVELPEPGTTLGQGEVLGTVESVKAVSDLLMPIGGEVIQTNAALSDMPQMINEDPYGTGWMIVVKPSDPAQLGALLSSQALLEKMKSEAS